MKLARVETFRYPDEPRYFYPAAVVADRPEYLMLFSPANSPVWSGKANAVWRTGDHALDVLFPDRNYNLIMFWNLDWTFSAYYVNIALPALWDGKLSSYVDLDLDVLYVLPSSRREGHTNQLPGVYELDRDEFEERRVEFAYPPEIVSLAEAALLEVQAHIAASVFPFDDSLLDFRPAADMMTLADLSDDPASWYI